MPRRAHERNMSCRGERRSISRRRRLLGAHQHQTIMQMTARKQNRPQNYQAAKSGRGAGFPDTATTPMNAPVYEKNHIKRAPARVCYWPQSSVQCSRERRGDGDWTTRGGGGDSQDRGNHCLPSSFSDPETMWDWGGRRWQVANRRSLPLRLVSRAVRERRICSGDDVIRLYRPAVLRPGWAVHRSGETAARRR